MAYRLGNGIWDGVFAVPNAVVDEHLKMASGVAVKVLLLLLRSGGKLDGAEIQKKLGHSAADIQDALHFWEQSGLIAPDDAPLPAAQPVLQTSLQYWEEPEQGKAPEPPAKEPAVGALPPRSSEKKRPGERRRLTTQEINEMASEDKNIEYLLQEAQGVMGRTLTPLITDTVVALYGYHGMQPDLILMLIHYCVSIGKGSVRYIEKVASDWIDRGIVTHERAEAEILRLTRQRTTEGKIKTAFGIHDRSLVASEKAYIQTWMEEYKLDLALITLAYERTIEIKGKLSFPYINGILTNWRNKGITTTVQAMKEIREKKPSAAPSQKADASYDIGELEKMINYSDI